MPPSPGQAVGRREGAVPLCPAPREPRRGCSPVPRPSRAVTSPQEQSLGTVMQPQLVSEWLQKGWLKLGQSLLSPACTAMDTQSLTQTFIVTETSPQTPCPGAKQPQPSLEGSLAKPQLNTCSHGLILSCAILRGFPHCSHPGEGFHPLD